MLILKAYAGHLPAWAAQTLYMAHVDLHLIFGADYVLKGQYNHIVVLQGLPVPVIVSDFENLLLEHVQCLASMVESFMK